MHLAVFIMHDPSLLRLEIVVEPWIDGLWSPLSSLLLRRSSEMDSIPNDTVTELKPSSSGISDSALAEQQSPEVHTDHGTVRFEGVNKGGNKEVNGVTSVQGSDGVLQSRLTDQRIADGINAPQMTSQSVEVDVTLDESVVAVKDTEGVDGQSENERVKSSNAEEVVSSLISSILQNLVLSNSPLLDPLGKVEGQGDVHMSTDHAVEGSCDQALLTSLKTRLTGLTGCTLSLPTIPHVYLQVVITQVRSN